MYTTTINIQTSLYDLNKSFWNTEMEEVTVRGLVFTPRHKTRRVLVSLSNESRQENPRAIKKYDIVASKLKNNRRNQMVRRLFLIHNWLSSTDPRYTVWFGQLRSILSLPEKQNNGGKISSGKGRSLISPLRCANKRQFPNDVWLAGAKFEMSLLAVQSSPAKGNFELKRIARVHRGMIKWILEFHKRTEVHCSRLRETRVSWEV